MAAVISAYNEERNIGRSMDYLNDLAEYIHVILVDDGSTDSTPKIMHEYEAKANKNLHFVYEPVNKRKVGAVKDCVRCIDELAGEKIDYIGMFDADGRIRNPDDLEDALEILDGDKELGGLALRIEPMNENNILAKMQKHVIYPVNRAIHRFTSGKRQIRCSPGGGSIYRREALEIALEEHSGKHSSDDFEITTSVQKHGWEMKYHPDIIVETVVPDTLKGYVDQQARWRLGGLQTMDKEGKFFAGKVKKGTRLGAVMGMEAALWASIPASIAYWIKCGIEGDAYGFLQTAATNTAISTAITGGMLYYNREELTNVKETLKMIPALPFYAYATFASSLIAGMKYLYYKASKSKEKAKSAAKDNEFSLDGVPTD